MQRIPHGQLILMQPRLSHRLVSEPQPNPSLHVLRDDHLQMCE
jgi:hypothetical protein